MRRVDSLPRLHIVTDDDVLRDSAFFGHARAVLQAGGPGVALHVRGHHTPTRRLLRIVEDLLPAARVAGALLLVNDRVDVALATDAHGVQLGVRSIPLLHARLLVRDRWIGYSAHGMYAAIRACLHGTDFVLLGTIYPSATHASSTGAGVDLVRRTAVACSAPVLAIGGVTAARIDELSNAGAFGVAVLGGVWRSAEPAASVRAYLAALEAHPRQWSGHAGNGNDSDRRER